MATGREGGRNKTGFVGRGAKPAGLEGALLGCLEGWRSCEQFILGPCPHTLHLYTSHPKLLSWFQPFSHFLSPKDGVIKHRFSREWMRHTGGGEEASSPTVNSHTITAHTLGPNPGVCPAAVQPGHTGMGIPGGSWRAAAAQTPPLYQQEKHPLSSSL